MRMKVSLFVAAAVTAATSAVFLNAGSASAIECPPGTVYKRFSLLGATWGACVPGQQCDPGPCDPTAAPNPE